MGKGAVWSLAIVFGLGLSGCGADDDDAGAGAGGAGMGGGGSGGTPAGTAATGAAGMAGGSSGDPNLCGGANTTTPPAALHTAALTALAGMGPMGTGSSCAASPSCHQGTGKAGLAFAGKTNLRELMVGKPSCEAPTIPVVADGGGDAALMGSWLWIKLTHPLDSAMNLMADPSWGTPVSCGQMPPGNFGLRMPWGLPSSDMWSHNPEIRDWICAGAPGP